MKWFKHEITTQDCLLKVRNKPGVYAIYVDSILVYIGQSIGVRQRLRYHVAFDFSTGTPYTRWGRGDISVKYRFSEKFGDWLMWEARLLKKLHPKGNTKTFKWRDYN